VHDAAAMLELLEQDRLAGTRLGWVIALGNDTALIGTIGLYKLQPEHQLAEVGFQLMPDQWGKGLMREALNAVVHFAFDQLGAHRVEAKTDPRNARTRTLLERCGFTLEGILRESYYWDGEFQGTAVYGRLVG
jgi:[ribosomal protein S5]-alanine N-acetyltransferase